MTTLNDTNYTITGCDLYFEASVAHASLDVGATLGAGSAFRTTARLFGNITTSEFAPDLTYLEHFTTDADGTKRKDHIVTSVKNITMPFTFDEINEDNLKKYFQGTSYANATLIDGIEPVFAVLSNTLEYGSAQIYIRTDIGNDLVYMVPKCTIRPEGNLTMNQESWWEVPMVLEVLYNTWVPANLSVSGTEPIVTPAPYGCISMKAIA